MTLKIKGIWLLALGVVVSGLTSSCNQSKGSNDGQLDVSNRVEAWGDMVKELNFSSEQKNSLVLQESEEEGFTITGSFENQPNRLLVLSEHAAQKMIFIDSSRTDTEGAFKLSGSVSEEVFCYLQFGPKDGIFFTIKNGADLQVKMSNQNGLVKYTIDGENVGSSKEVQRLYNVYMEHYMNLKDLQDSANKINPSDITPALQLQWRHKYEEINNNRINSIVHFIQQSSNSLAPYFAVNFMLEEPSINTLEIAANKVSAYNKDSKYAKSLRAKVKDQKLLAIGSPAPEINLSTPEGEKRALSSLKGKVVLIDFWASWCRPCRMANPYNRELYAKYKDKGFEIYAVSLDRTKDQWVAAIKADQLPWVHVSDLKHWSSVAAKLYKVHGIPYTVLLDKEGKIVAKNPSHASLEGKIKELLEIQ